MKSCIIFIAASFALWNPLLALGREFDGDEFSNDTLAYKLELLNHTFGGQNKSFQVAVW